MSALVVAPKKQAKIFRQINTFMAINSTAARTTINNCMPLKKTEFACIHCNMTMWVRKNGAHLPYTGSKERVWESVVNFGVVREQRSNRFGSEMTLFCLSDNKEEASTAPPGPIARLGKA